MLLLLLLLPLFSLALCANMIFRLLLWRACWILNTFCNEKQIHITFNAIVPSYIWFSFGHRLYFTEFMHVHFNVIYGRKFTCTRPHWMPKLVEMNVTRHSPPPFVRSISNSSLSLCYPSQHIRHWGFHLIHFSSWPKINMKPKPKLKKLLKNCVRRTRTEE